MAVTVMYRTPDMSCEHCVRAIETELKEVEGVLTVRADLATKQVTVTFEPPATEDDIKNVLADIGYPVAEG